MEEIKMHLHNIRTILINSNATPIRCYASVGYKCAFCLDNYENPRDLKRHTLQTHNDSEKGSFMKGVTMNVFMVKLDITGLRCRTCNASAFKLESFVDHLQTEHGLILYKDLKNHILPFNFKGGSWNCVACAQRYRSFNQMQHHMNTHYGNYICEVCDGRFINQFRLNSHGRQHKLGVFSCKFCGEVFINDLKRVNHERVIHIIGERILKEMSSLPRKVCMPSDKN